MLFLETLIKSTHPDLRVWSNVSHTPSGKEPENQCLVGVMVLNTSPTYYCVKMIIRYMERVGMAV